MAVLRMVEVELVSGEAKAVALGSLAKVWAGLTEPHASIRSPEKRRRARVLSALLIMTLGLGLLAQAITVAELAQGVGERSAVWQVLVPLALLCGVYALSRGRFATLAAAITLAILLASTLLVPILSPGESVSLAYVLLPGLVSGLLFSAPVTVSVFALTLGSLLAIPALQPLVSASALLDLGFLIAAVGSLMVVASSMRDRDVRQIEAQSQRLEGREAMLHEATRKLSVSATALEQRNRESELLVEMSHLLQVCSSAQEAVEVFVSVGRRLFREEVGCLYIFRASRDVVELLGTWGPEPGRAWQQTFTLEDCIGLRLGRPHNMEHAGEGLACGHLPEPLPAHSLCVPLLAQAEVLGLFHLHREVSRAAPGGRLELDEGGWGTERLAVQLADLFSLALSNLNLRDRLRHESILDSLTGLFNRRYLDVTLERELQRAQRSHRPLAVTMFDLDHFKRLNDAYGHQAGDAALRVLGNFLEENVRAGDIACRFGGEEIVLVLPEAPLTTAAARAEALLAGVRQLRIEHRGGTLPGLTMSGEIAGFPEHGKTAQELLHLADQALYQAKAQGRDRVVVAAAPELGSGRSRERRAPASLLGADLLVDEPASPGGAAGGEPAAAPAVSHGPQVAGADTLRLVGVASLIGAALVSGVLALGVSRAWRRGR